MDKSDDIDLFIHFDSASPNLDDDNALNINLPSDGVYYASLQNIALEYPDVYNGDIYSGFLGICGFRDIQSCTFLRNSYAIPKSTAIFPLTNPTDARPTSKVYSKITLKATDTINIKYYDNTMTRIAGMKRIVATIHLSDNPDVIRISL